MGIELILTCQSRGRDSYLFGKTIAFILFPVPFQGERIGNSVPKSIFENSDMGGASYRLVIRACAGGSLWIAHRATLYVSCREKRRSMASAPDESGATAELQQLKVHDEDYNPFTEEGN